MKENGKLDDLIDPWAKLTESLEYKDPTQIKSPKMIKVPGKIEHMIDKVINDRFNDEIHQLTQNEHDGIMSDITHALNNKSKAMSYEEWKLWKDTQKSLKRKLYKEA